MIYALEGHVPEIDPSAWVAPDAVIVGKVRIGPGASVWFGSVLRGDNEWIEIGAGSNVQEHCVMHTDPGYPLRVGPGCTIGHKAMLHGCTIGEGALIGMGATVLNGAVIGAESLVGACALITEGKEIAPGSLVVGAPGRVVRALDAEAIEGLKRSAQHYQANAARFRDGLREIG
ncbi:gamma carbonic anhydrase family protein [Frigidibacter sp. ROC022]|uniref:gamma carbonic anhydrase family protein n=1 Tax=Frigidibacter sp. ROC022 TaxID=2971796 RepID=UPI00215B1FA9|nr:gamma carbonic anhydrase family protein [Frigidibacter sp. ROC022]MCR8726342.1 gamma carbonic anhydrase family protein [Frigidibacter sp. ROC022]